MIVRSVYPLKSFPTLKEAQVHVKKINSGAGKHADAKLEIHFNEKAHKKVALKGPKAAAGGLFTQNPNPPKDSDEVDEAHKWIVVVCDSSPIPGGSTCAECEGTFFGDDYLCDSPSKADS
jgi:hypothetical protein